MSRMKAAVAAALFAATAVGTNVGVAFAGELTGGPNPKPTQGPAHANSICVFSGQNDDPDAPLVLDDFVVAPNGPGGRTQSFGQDVKLGRDPHLFTPGDACRGGSNEPE
jgi:hypothetical protein